MARLNASLLRKVKNVLTRRFPPPATVKLEDVKGIIGVITSEEFFGMKSLARQDLIHNTIDPELTREERNRIQAIVGVTPDEGTGYLASVDE